ncbi:M48 family metalloprotease [Methylophaga sp. OBS4]|uniref:M48 family metalloprotease n=1 Tax=Methylophaga sp. OBS4 TaxID=2991935 RepID=UPI00224CA544|nr:M48 family metalloprotease [Methylophaga sp. OBS4]MCX4186396.1 M48 family metalloprotease [Methylophaga sp. OBS4]
MLNVFVQGCTSHDRFRSLCLLVGALLFMGLAGCAQNPVTGEQDFVLFGEDKELAIGRDYHPKIIAEYGRYDDEVLQAYVQSVGEKLAAVSHRDDLIYRFTVLDTPVINAFALPGGYIYITRGLMAYLNSEAELAAVLGHEIGHVTARHGVRQQSAAQAANLGYTLGAILFPELRASGSQNLFNILGGALLSGYGREHELESDRLGAEYLARAGYTPHAMIDVISVLKDQETFAAAEAKKQGRDYQGYHGLFASHPDNDTRLQQVVSAADQYISAQNGQVLRDAYLQKIRGMTFGDSEDQGIRSDNHFYHLSMRFSLDFPPNWHINNNPDSLQAIAPEGKALIEMGAADINRKLTPQQFIQQRLKIDDLRSGRTLSNHGLEGYTGLTTHQNRPLRVGVVYLRDQAFIFLGSSKNSREFGQFDNDILDTINSLHSLRDEEIELARELKIDIVTVNKDDSYAKWAGTSRISNSPLQQLRLLNGDYPDAELKPGQNAKIIR